MMTDDSGSHHPWTLDGETVAFPPGPYSLIHVVAAVCIGVAVVVLARDIFGE